MKPTPSIAMRNLIDQVRTQLPFDADESRLCSDNCQGCSKKLLEFLDAEIEGWEQKLQEGIQPDFGELHQLGKTCKKVYLILKKNGLIQ